MKKSFMHTFKSLYSALIVITYACSNPSIPNTLTETEKSQGWKLLFDGKSLENWHLYNSPDFKGAWYVENGEIRANPDEQGKRTDLISDLSYENYELTFEWKLSREGNSGIFINVQEHDTLATPWLTGPEYQLLDDSHPDFDKPLKKAGCLYGFTPQKNYVNTKKRGEWNESRIIQYNGLIKFYLNNVLTAEMDLKSEHWKKAVEKSTFRDKPEFGKRTSGKIGLQDWAHGVAFRNIKIREL